MYNSMTATGEPSGPAPTGLLGLFSHHGAWQDIHISDSSGREGFPRPGDGVALWAEDATEDGSLHNSPGYPNRSALVRVEPSDCVSARLIWARINSPALWHLFALCMICSEHRGPRGTGSFLESWTRVTWEHTGEDRAQSRHPQRF